MVDVAVCTIAKGEAAYLVEWIALHRVVGVEAFFVYDNDDPGSTQSLLLEQLHACGVVVRIPWRGEYPHGPQLPAYRHWLDRWRDSCEWVAVLDLDEFICPVKYDTIQTFVAQYPAASAVALPWVVFGSAGETVARDAPVVRRFTKCQRNTSRAMWRPVKSIVRAARARSLGIHVHEIDCGDYIDATGHQCLCDSHGKISGQQLSLGIDTIRVNHYFTKSREEWNRKRARGRADRGVNDPARIRDQQTFAAWDLNHVEDVAILAYYERTLTEIQAIADMVGPVDIGVADASAL
jgi:hypothetical protein